MVMTTEPPEGKVGMLPLTVFPDTDITPGQTAPPAAAPQIAVFGIKLTSRISLKLVLLAALGPVLLICIV
jgi:hypothetical protein